MTAIFFILNLLDCISTFIGIKLGLSEGNFLLGKLFDINIWLGLAVKMLLCIVIVVVLYFIDKLHLLLIINWAFLAIVLWNVGCIIVYLIISKGGN